MKKFILMLILLTACSKLEVRNEQLGKEFPQIKAISLAGKEYELPKDLGSNWSVLVVAYKQKTQFDVDRWAYGLLDANLPVKFYELPTIRGVVPSMLEDVISNGMRSGIPKPDWDLVLTVFEDAEKLVNITGNDKSQNAQVILLDEKGQIRWFHNDGYSPRVLLELRDFLRSQQ